MGAAPSSVLALSGAITETVGTLKLSGASVVDFGTGAARMNFANSSAETWTGGLSVWNWSGNVGGGGTDQLFFGTGLGGLTPGQATSVQFFSGAGTGGLGAGNLLASGELVPVPEPAALLSVPVLLFAFSSRELARSRPGAQGV